MEPAENARFSFSSFPVLAGRIRAHFWVMGDQCFFLSAVKFLVAFGSLIFVFSNRPACTLTWHPSLDVGVSPKAMSKMSSSSYFGPLIFSYKPCSKMTWQVEQANPPSQAPSRSTLFWWAISSSDFPSSAITFVSELSLLIKVKLTFFCVKLYFGSEWRWLALTDVEPCLATGLKTRKENFDNNFICLFVKKCFFFI